MAKPLKKRTLPPGIRIVTVRLSEDELQHLRSLKQKRGKKFRRVVPYQEIMVHSLMGMRAQQVRALPEPRSQKSVHTLTIRLVEDEMQHLLAIQAQASSRRAVSHQEIMARGLMDTKQ